VHALINHGGLLYVGGKSPAIKSWNGTAWGTLGSIPGTLTAWVRTFYDYNGDLLAGVASAPSGAYRWKYVLPLPIRSMRRQFLTLLSPTPRRYA
jgi:hypothetical protein